VLSLVVQEFNIPIVASLATNPALSNKDAYPTVSRLQPSDACACCP
jgi:hypothetical protein